MNPTLTELETQLAGAEAPRIRQQAVDLLSDLRGRHLQGSQTVPADPEASQQHLRRQTMLSACDAALRVLQTEGATPSATHT